jgi:hypothetical protein
LLLLGFIDSGLRSVSNSFSRFGVFFLAGGSVVPPAIDIVGCSSALLLLFIDSYNVVYQDVGHIITSDTLTEFLPLLFLTCFLHLLLYL